MKVLLDHHLPFALAHGGLEHQLLQTRTALGQVGVDTDFVRWWDASQRGDVIHFVGRPTADYITFAQGRGCRVVIADLIMGAGSRSGKELALQKTFIKLSRRLLPATFTVKMAWDAYRVADACIAITDWEAHLMNYLFDAPKERLHVVPNGVEEFFFDSPKTGRGQWLVCTATITVRKRVLELAQAAVQAQTPLWVLGRPYSDSDPYAQNFLALAKQHPQVLRYEGAVSDRTQLPRIYREARGFVLLSTMETQSLSALEAAACECPLLLADLPWARSTFKNGVKYCPITKSPGQTAAVLREFYEAAPSLPPPPRPSSWADVARQFKSIYEHILQAPK
jgi:glycosyltransferase involved in cell wall biosynthesis